MFLYLELFHPGKVTSFSHRLAAVPLNLALVPPEHPLQWCECLLSGLEICLLSPHLKCPSFSLVLSVTPDSISFQAWANGMLCCAGNLTSTSPVCVAVCHYSRVVHQSRVLPAFLRLHGFLRETVPSNPASVPSAMDILSDGWPAIAPPVLCCEPELTREQTPLPRRVQPRCSPDRVTEIC